MYCSQAMKWGYYSLISFAECAFRAGTMPEAPVAISTIVSTDMADAVAGKYGVEMRRTLTGFKFIGEQIGLLEQQGEVQRISFWL